MLEGVASEVALKGRDRERAPLVEELCELRLGSVSGEPGPIPGSLVCVRSPAVGPDWALGGSQGMGRLV